MTRSRRGLRSLSLGLCAAIALMGVGSASGSVAPALAVAADPEKVDAAVDRGLNFLASVQAEEGFFDGSYGRSAGVVSLCGMAFLAKGYSPRNGPYSDNLRKCIAYVLSIQDKEGTFGLQGGADRRMYSHNITTLFLSEVSGMVEPASQPRINAALAKAVAVILRAQQVAKADVYKGGWRYEPGSTDSDLSCSGWALMALRSARLNGAAVSDAAIKDAVGYIMRNHKAETGEFGYQDGTTYATSLTGAALLCLELTGHHGEQVTIKAGNYVVKVRADIGKSLFPDYGTYYAAQGTFQLGGRYWQTFSSWMYEYWLPLQKADGSWAPVPGSWMAGQGAGDNSYVTAMVILSLTVPYRQLPIYQRDETVDEDDEKK